MGDDSKESTGSGSLMSSDGASTESWLESLISKYEGVLKSPAHNMEEKINALDSNADVEEVATWICNILQILASKHGKEEEKQSFTSVWEFIEVCFKNLKAAKISIQDEDNPHYYKCFGAVKNLLMLGGEIRTPDKGAKFDSWVEIAKSCFPKHAESITILNVSSNLRGFYLMSLQLCVIAHSDKTKANSIMRAFVDFYRKYSGKDSVYALEVACQSLCKFHLYMGSNSPLTTGSLKSDAVYDVESDAFEWLDFANKGEPYDKIRLREFAGAGDLELERLTWSLASNIDRRMELLDSLVKKLPRDSLVFSEAAMLLSVHKLRQSRDLIGAEKLIYDAISQMDEDEFPVFLFSPLLSELGMNSLITYGDILLANKKYFLGILAFESATLCYRLRTGEDHFAMFKRLADICEEHDDWGRALFYYRSLLRRTECK
jgi:hypothetical protein